MRRGGQRDFAHRIEIIGRRTGGSHPEVAVDPGFVMN